MNDVREISDLIARMLLSLDRLDWSGVRRAFGERVRVDYTSLSGGTPVEMPADELIAQWRALLPGFDATQHITGPIVVNADHDSIVAETTVRGYHLIRHAAGGSQWMVAGTYTIGVRPAPATWQITSLTLTVAYQDGNGDLPELARRRVVEGTQRSPGRPDRA